MCGSLVATVVAMACSRAESDLAYLRGWNAADDGRFDLARRYFAEHLESNPNDSRALRGAARAWMSGAMQSPGRAEPFWEALLALEPDDIEAHLRLGEVKWFVGDAEAALAHLDSVPPDPDVDAQRAEILLGTDPSAALDFARRRLEESGDPGLALTAAQASELLGRFEDTLIYARQAILADPLNPTSHYLLSRSLERTGDAGGAREEAHLHGSLLALTVSSGATRGTPLERLRLIDGLMAAMDPVPDSLRLVRLDALVDAGLLEESRRALETVLNDAEHTGAAASQLAGWSERLGMLEQARRWLTTALEQASDEQSRRLLRHRLARVLRATDPDEAAAFLRAALVENPAVAKHHCMLGELAIEGGDEDAAIASLERALELAPWRADCRLGLIEVWQARGQRKAVAQILAAAPETAPELSSFRERYGYPE